MTLITSRDVFYTNTQQFVLHQCNDLQQRELKNWNYRTDVEFATNGTFQTLSIRKSEFTEQDCARLWLYFPEATIRINNE